MFSKLQHFIVSSDRKIDSKTIQKKTKFQSIVILLYDSKFYKYKGLSLRWFKENAIK